MSPKRPNLFIVGAMKAGTSSLHAYLHRHPSIFMCEPKEPCFFVARNELDWPAIEKLELWKESNYLRLFADSGEVLYRGESSTLYAKAPRISGVPERIARYSPDARILYLMRDPIERTVSHYWHAVRWEREHRDLPTALQQEPHFTEVSYYAMQLQPYLELFGPDRVATFTLEELSTDTPRVLRAVCSWLGLSPDDLPEDLTGRENVTPAAVEKVRGRGRLERFRWSPLWNRIGGTVPKPLRSLGRALATTSVVRQDVGLEEAVELLRPRQLEETSELSQTLGRDFPEWSTLYGE